MASWRNVLVDETHRMTRSGLAERDQECSREREQQVQGSGQMGEAGREDIVVGPLQATEWDEVC